MIPACQNLGPTTRRWSERNRLLTQTRTITLGAVAAARHSLAWRTAFAHAHPRPQLPPVGGPEPADRRCLRRRRRPVTGPASARPGRCTARAPSQAGAESGDRARHHHAIAPPSTPGGPGHLLRTSAPPPPRAVPAAVYATRATGVVALVLMTATVVLGVATAAGRPGPGLPRVVSAGLHRNLSLLVLGFVSLHVLTTVADSYTNIGLSSVIIPFNSDYRRLWLGLGTIAFDLLLAVALTSLLRDRLSYRAWRAVHWLAYACWPIALWHGLGTGTDAQLPWLLALDVLCVATPSRRRSGGGCHPRPRPDHGTPTVAPDPTMPEAVSAPAPAAPRSRCGG